MTNSIKTAEGRRATRHEQAPGDDAPTTETGREVRAWLADNWSPEMTLRDWWHRLADSGWAYPNWPTAWFGRGLDQAAVKIVDDELTRVGAIAPPASGGQRLAGPTILAHGNDDQRRRLLPGLVYGEEAWCQLFSEPDAGSDLASVRTRAVRQGSGWRVSGQKIWTSGAQVSDRAFLLARTGTREERHRGLTYLIVDLDQPGVTVQPLRQMTGESAFNQVFLDDVIVEDRDVIGDVGGGWSVAMTTLGMERFAARSGSRGGYHWSTTPYGVPGRRSTTLDRTVADLLQSARESVAPRSDVDELIESMVAMAVESGQIGRPEVRASLVDLYILSTIARHARVTVETTDGAGAPNGSVRKLLRSRMSAAARDAAVALGPGAGLRGPGNRQWAGSLEAVILSSPAASVAGGTDEIQRNVIGERVLGLPREARPAEGVTDHG